MVDIDDTLVDANETTRYGFESMLTMYQEASLLYPVHVVTARPDDQHGNVMQLLRSRGFSLPPDRLHMLPEHLYGKGHEHVERFKWGCFKNMMRTHGGVIARFGDMLWDVAALDSLHPSPTASEAGYLSHVKDGDCYMFMDPKMPGTASFKLPGNSK
jgi:hypothetical protein